MKENQLLRDLNILAPRQTTSARFEVIANGLPFWEGQTSRKQVVSALTGRGVARGRRQGQASTRRNRTSAAGTRNCSPGPGAIPP